MDLCKSLSNHLVSRYLICLLTFLISQVTHSQSENKTELLDRILVIVNNELILDSDLRALDYQSKKGLLDESLFFGKNSEKILESLDSRREFLIQDRLVESIIEELKLRNTMDAVLEEIRQIAKSNRMSLEDLYRNIEAQGLTRAEYQSNVKNRIERNALKQQILARVRVTDEDILNECYRQNSSLSRVSEQRSVAHIFLSSKKRGLQDAEQRAQSAHQILLKDSDFDVAAQKFTDDGDYKPGALLGDFFPGELAPEFDQALAKLEVGQFSPPIKTKNGFHILKLVAIRKKAHPQCEREKDKIQASLNEAGFEKQFQAFLEIKRQQANIRINP
ncbi:MAG: peptidylprolyl isomerase [Bdellovibrio sp.]